MFVSLVKRNHDRTSQRGLAAVEATLVLPIMLLLLLAIGEFGRVLYQYNTLTKAVRSGALAISRDGSWIDNPVTRTEQEGKVKNLVVYGNENAGNPVLLGLTTSDVSISSDEQIPFGSGAYYTKVSVSYDWQPIFGDTFHTFFGEDISLSFPLKSSMTVRVK